eukprot:220463_1
MTLTMIKPIKEHESIALSQRSSSMQSEPINSQPINLVRCNSQMEYKTMTRNSSVFAMFSNVNSSFFQTQKLKRNVIMLLFTTILFVTIGCICVSITKLAIFWIISDVATWVLFSLLMHTTYTLYQFKCVLSQEMREMLQKNDCDDITEIIHDYKQKNNIPYLPLFMQRIKNKLFPKKISIYSNK